MRRAALTVWQPWAWAICAGHKDVENRRWSIEPQRVLIHAGRQSSLDPVGLAAIAERGIALPAELRFGAIIGAVTIDRVIENSSSSWAARGQLHWLLRDPELFEQPVPCRGLPGLFDADRALTRR